MKFKVGDKVRLVDSSPYFHGRIGVVSSININKYHEWPISVGGRGFSVSYTEQGFRMSGKVPECRIELLTPLELFLYGEEENEENT